MKLRIRNIKNLLIWVGTALLVFVSIGFSAKEIESRICGDVIIRISNRFDNYFINEEDLFKIISNDGKSDPVGMKIEDLDLKALEAGLKNEKFVKNAQVYIDLKGNVVVLAEQRRPVARIARPDAHDAYIDEEGAILPLSGKFTSRVMLITGEYTDRLLEEGLVEDNMNYMDLILKVNSDPFWKAQISQLDIDADGEISLYTQVSKQVVEFGLPEDLDTKFRKLDIFYKQILPFKGWNSYERVNIKYLNQIVCE